MDRDTGGGFVSQRYQLLDKLGSGGMGSVFKARDRLNGQMIALKRVLVPENVPNEAALTLRLMTEQIRTALADEFQALASMHHPHVIQVLDYGFDQDHQPFFTMNLIDKARTVLEAGRDQPLEARCQLIIQMAEALAYLHRRGMIHRDLKPDNALVTTESNVKLLDFGLATLSEGQEHSDTIVGTLAYMAPEILRGGLASTASDFYALGVIAYELFTGHHPFSTDSASELVMAVLSQKIDVENAGVDPELTYILSRLLESDPEQRYEDAYEIIADLSAALRQPVPVESIEIRESYLQAARFVGRETELAHLTGALNKIFLDGEGSSWLIGGESGVGKSRLLDELHTRGLVKGALVLRGQAVQGGGVSYQLWRDPIRRLLLTLEIEALDAGILKEIIPDMDQLLGNPVAEVAEVSGAANQERLLTTIVSLFQRLRSPVLLLIEESAVASRKPRSAQCA